MYLLDCRSALQAVAISDCYTLYLQNYGAPPHLGILQLKSFSPTNIRPHRQTVPRCIYNRSGQIFTTTNGEYINQRTNSGRESFLRQLRRPLLRWWDPVVKLFSSRPQIPIRFVFFGHFWGRRRILAVFWCFCGPLAVGLEPI